MSFLLQQILLEPERILTLDNEQLTELLSQARGSRLMGSLSFELQQAGVSTQLPHTVTRHVQSGQLIYEKQKRDLAYDAQLVKVALDSIGEKLVLLKGAAYILAELRAGRGRYITDIDIIVPRQRIEEAEKALVKFGWNAGEVDAYDDHYYRKWGHEIPALTHPKRETTLDVHHNILPPTAGPTVDATLLFERLVEVRPGIFTLSRHDMVIHSATHLFHEGEFHHGLRDLWDLNRMLRDFPADDPQFWEGLVSRAQQLQLTGSLFHGLHYANLVFLTPIPASILEESGTRLRTLRKPLMDFLFLRALRPDHPACTLRFTGLALNMLYLRSHYLRMPLYLLLPHLARKAWMRRFNSEKPD
jgi:hypothetical protein